MSSIADPLQIAATSAAIAWPVAAGATLVLWTKIRAADRRRKLALIEGGLQGLFRNVERQGVPDRLELVIEALEEHQAMTRIAAAAARKTTPAS